MNKKKIFIPSADSIVSDVLEFLNKEFPLLKTPESWKAEILDTLSRQEIPSSVEHLKAAEVDKFNTVCGSVMAKLLLNSLPNSYKADRELFTECFLIQILEKAAEIVFAEESRYDATNFVEGFYSNVEELLYTEIKNAEITQKQPNQCSGNQEVSESKAAPDSKDASKSKEAPGTKEISDNQKSAENCKPCNKCDENCHCNNNDNTLLGVIKNITQMLKTCFEEECSSTESENYESFDKSMKKMFEDAACFYGFGEPKRTEEFECRLKAWLNDFARFVGFEKSEGIDKLKVPNVPGDVGNRKTCDDNCSSKDGSTVKGNNLIKIVVEFL